MMKKIALVTGANKGIGFEVARQLAGAGCHVLMGARSAEQGEKAVAVLKSEGLDVEFVELDLDRHETMASTAKMIEGKFGRLDILVNNAGVNVAGDGPPATAELGAVQRTMEVNFVGTLAVTQAMLPLVEKSESGRIVNVSSGLGSLTQLGDPAYPYNMVKMIGYSASKAALNMLTVQLAFLLRETKVKVNSSDPGYTATDLNGNRGTQTVPEGAAETVRLALLPEDGPTGGYFDTAGRVQW